MPTEVHGAERHNRPLTAETIKEIVRELAGTGTTSERGERVRRDWRAFVESEFRLTAVQRDRLYTIPASEATKIHKGLIDVLDAGGDVELRLPTAGQPDGELVIRPRHRARAGAQTRIVIPIVTCKFDAHCGGWECNVGPARAPEA